MDRRITLSKLMGLNTVLIMALWIIAQGPALQGQAFSIPSSNKLLEVDLVLPDGRTAKVYVREGAMSTIRDASRGYHYALIGTLDKVTSAPKITFLEITNLDDGGQRVEKVGEQKDLMIGARARIATKHGEFEFRLMGVGVGSFPTPPLEKPLKTIPSPTELKRIYANPAGTCCVTCDSVTVCASSVQLDCGSCDGVVTGRGRPAI